MASLGDEIEVGVLQRGFCRAAAKSGERPPPPPGSGCPGLVLTRAVMLQALPPAGRSCSQKTPTWPCGRLRSRAAGVPVNRILPVVYDDELVAHRLHILNDVGGQQHQPVLGRLGKEVAEVDAAPPGPGPPWARQRSGTPGLPSRAWAMPTRWRWPPERVRILARRFSSRLTARMAWSMADRRFRSPFRAAM